MLHIAHWQCHTGTIESLEAARKDLPGLNPVTSQHVAAASPRLVSVTHMLMRPCQCWKNSHEFALIFTSLRS